VNLDALSTSSQIARGLRVPYTIGPPLAPTGSEYLDSLLSILSNFRNRSQSSHLHLSVPSTPAGCSYVHTVAQRLSVLEERLHHSVSIYAPFRRGGEDCFVSNGEWVYTVVIALLGPAIQVR